MGCCTSQPGKTSIKKETVTKVNPPTKPVVIPNNSKLEVIKEGPLIKESNLQKIQTTVQNIVIQPQVVPVVMVSQNPAPTIQQQIINKQYKYTQIETNLKTQPVQEPEELHHSQVNAVNDIEKHLDQKILNYNMDTGDYHPSPNIYTFEYGSFRAMNPIVGSHGEAKAY